MNGDLPPSSKDSGTRLAPAAAAICRAVATEPVKLRRRILGWRAKAAPASRPMPCTTLNTPSGSPASAVMSASSDAVSGAHSGGL